MMGTVTIGDGTGATGDVSSHVVRVAWAGTDRLMPIAANQFAVQVSKVAPDAPADIVVTAGYLTPPLLLGDEEQQVAQMMATESVEVQAFAKIVVKPEIAKKLVVLLNAVIERAESVEGGFES